jgi:maleylpyruvate isomerase
MSAPIAMLTTLRTSTDDLLRGIDAEQWTDKDVGAPSLLPGWTRGHVLTHIARNADGITRTLAGALRGDVVARYPNGRAGRYADIEAGATRRLSSLTDDVRESAERLDRLFVAVGEADGWDLPTEDRPARDYIAARWREVEIHRVDLAGTYQAGGWPAAFVSYLLPELADGLDERGVDALRIEVTPQDSVTTDLAGAVWKTGTGEPITVAAPDWALVAWLIGRPAAAAGALGEVPDLGRWL